MYVLSVASSKISSVVHLGLNSTLDESSWVKGCVEGPLSHMPWPCKAMHRHDLFHGPAGHHYWIVFGSSCKSPFGTSEKRKRNKAADFLFLIVRNQRGRRKKGTDGGKSSR